MFSATPKIAVALVAMAIVLASNGKARAQQNRGSLKAVDADKRTITLAFSPKDEVTYNVAEEATVYIADGKTIANPSDPLDYLKLKYRMGNFADLQEGAHVVAAIKRPAKMIVAIWAVGPTVVGVVGAVDDKKSTVTLTFPGKKGADAHTATYRVGQDTDLFIDGKKAIGVWDMVPGANVHLTLTGDLKEVGKIWAQGAYFNGFLKAVDAEKKSITLTIAEKKGDPGVDKTLKLAAGVKIYLYGQNTDVKKLPLGTRLNAELSGSANEVTRITVGYNSVGALDDLDLVNNTITLFYGKHVPGQTGTFKVLKDAQVTLPDGTSGKLSDLRKTDARVTVWFTWNERDVVTIVCDKTK